MPSKPGNDEPKTGDQLAHYRLLEQLGKGGMGVVFKAYEETLARYTAVKVLPKKLLDEEEFVKRFLAEARAVAKLNHPNIIQVYCVAHEEEATFFAMEFVEGRDLHSILSERRCVTESDAINWIRQAALGLQHAQKRGVIHRDIKPDNLMLTNKGVIKIADFGLSKKVDAETGESLHLTSTGVILGTPHYMSPEQIKGEKKVDYRSDIYGLGATLYHLLAGRPPFVGESAVAIMVQHLQTPLQPIRELNPAVSPQLDRILHKALAKDVDKRYQSYNELIRDLDSTLVAPSGTVGLSHHARRVVQSVAVVLLLLAFAGGILWFRSNDTAKILPEKPAETVPVPSVVLESTPEMVQLEYVPLDISAARNADVISTASHDAVDIFEPYWKSSLATTSFLAQHGFGVEGMGIPDDGHVKIPLTGPPAFFQLRMPPDKNVILLTDSAGRQPNPVTLDLSANQIGKYSRVAVLHGACWGNGIISMQVHYESGADDRLELRVLDWNDSTRPEPPGPDKILDVKTRTAGSGQNHEAHLFAQTFGLDSERALKSLTFSFKSSTQPKGLRLSNEGRFTTGIFAVSVLPSPPSP